VRTVPPLYELEWLTLPQGDRAQWAKNHIEYIEVWRWRSFKPRYSITLFHTDKKLEAHCRYPKLNEQEANNIVCEYSDPLLAYCYKLVESGEAEPLPYNGGKPRKLFGR
jgi:hypothetical protein